MGKRRRPDAHVRCPTAYNSHDAIRLAPSVEPARAVRMNEPMAMPIDQVPAHLPAGVRGLNGLIAAALFLLRVANDVPGRAQNGIGPWGALSLNRET